MNTKSYIACRFMGYNLKVLPESSDKTFLEICCKGPSNSTIPFAPIRSSRFARVFRFEYRGEGFYYKLFLQRDLVEWLKEIFRCSRAERALKGHLLLEENGFDAPRINVIGVKGGNNFIVSQEVKNIDVHRLFRQVSAAAQSKGKKTEKKALIDHFAHTIGRLHKLGISHGDLRLGNVLVDISNPLQPHYFFLDNERTMRYKKLPKCERLKNIVQISISLNSIATNNDRLRFFHSYLKENPELIPLKKQWLACIIHKTEKRLERRARHHSADSKNPLQADRRHDYV